MALVAVIVIGAAIRLPALDTVPPGLNVDEASNSWNASCLIRTGQDEHGKPWPVLYTRAFGENRSTSYLYALLPFQVVAGPGRATTRLPAAVLGIVTLVLLWWVGARLFDPTVGLLAAALLAVNPWHVQVSRLGLEASLGAFLILLAVVAILAAGLPPGTARRPPGTASSVAAGALAAVACYGYWGVRLFLPVFLIGAAAVTWRYWAPELRTRRGAVAVLAFAIAFLLILTPLGVAHVADASTMSKRGLTGLVWEADDPVSARTGKILERYVAHFGPSFLFIHGDRYPMLALPRSGAFHAYTLPFMLVGIAVLLARCRSEWTARVLVVWVALYPVGDLIKDHPGTHALRSLPGAPGLTLVAAVGAVAAWRWARPRAPRVAVGLAVVVALTAAAMEVRFLKAFFGEFHRETRRYVAYQADLIEAFGILRDRMDDLDGVWCTSSGIDFPYVNALVGLGYDPVQWFRDDRRYHDDGEWLECIRFGKVHFLPHDANREALVALRNNDRRDRVALVVRPGELDLGSGTRPEHVITTPDGTASLEIYLLEL